MSRLEYELLREQEPQLHLPMWSELEFSPIFLGFVKSKTREEMIGVVTSAILLGKYPPNLKAFHPPGIRH
jgi:hypothetical protein